MIVAEKNLEKSIHSSVFGGSMDGLEGENLIFFS
jgi:hypothetical protein